MLDFTSALYLGLRHPSRSLAPLVGAHDRPAGGTGIAGRRHRLRAAAGRVARLRAGDAAPFHAAPVLGPVWPSRTRASEDLHGRGHLCGCAMGRRAGGAQGSSVRRFPHHDTAAARAADRAGQPERQPPRHRRRWLLSELRQGRADRAVPAMCRRRAAAKLVLDDTQALGLLGARPSDTPMADGGGGSLRWRGLSSPHVIVGGSLAKALGVPMAVLSGSEPVIRRFEQKARPACIAARLRWQACAPQNMPWPVNRLHGDDRAALPGATRRTVSRKVAADRPGGTGRSLPGADAGSGRRRSRRSAASAPAVPRHPNRPGSLLPRPRDALWPFFSPCCTGRLISIASSRHSMTRCAIGQSNCQ